MLEKVNMYHPDKVADRVAGALVDFAYSEDEAPKIAVEVLIGHGRATVVVETSIELDDRFVEATVMRIADIAPPDLTFIQVSQDVHLSRNQREGVRCGDNGVFTAKWNPQYEEAISLAKDLGKRFPYDGKYLFDFTDRTATICQSNSSNSDILQFSALSRFKTLIVNPLGEWVGGTNTDAGCTNRKLGSDQPYCNPNGLHGKDLSKADVSVSIYINSLSRKNNGAFVKAFCSIGSSAVTIIVEGHDAVQINFEDIVAFSKDYITNLGGFEKFAEYGVVW